MNNDLIKHMVARFLSWKLPSNFNPDGGITFERVANAQTPHPHIRQPSGTNLLDAVQAEAMVRHLFEGVTDPEVARRIDALRDAEWFSPTVKGEQDTSTYFAVQEAVIGAEKKLGTLKEALRPSTTVKGDGE